MQGGELPKPDTDKNFASFSAKNWKYVRYIYVEEIIKLSYLRSNRGHVISSIDRGEQNNRQELLNCISNLCTYDSDPCTWIEKIESQIGIGHTSIILACEPILVVICGQSGVEFT